MENEVIIRLKKIFYWIFAVLHNMSLADDKYEEFYDYEDDYDDEDEAYDAAVDYWYDNYDDEEDDD